MARPGRGLRAGWAPAAGWAKRTVAAFEADMVSEVTRREGHAKAEEMLRSGQRRSRHAARRTARTAGRLGWSPDVADRLAEGAITPEAAGLILDAAADTPVDEKTLLEAAVREPEDLFRRTLKDHVNERTGEAELERRRESQRRRRRAWVGEGAGGMLNLHASFDPLTDSVVRDALYARSDRLFRAEDPRNRATAPSS